MATIVNNLKGKKIIYDCHGDETLVSGEYRLTMQNTSDVGIIEFIPNKEEKGDVLLDFSLDDDLEPLIKHLITAQKYYGKISKSTKMFILNHILDDI